MQETITQTDRTDLTDRICQPEETPEITLDITTATEITLILCTELTETEWDITTGLITWATQDWQTAETREITEQDIT